MELAAVDWLDVSPREATELQPLVSTILATVDELLELASLDAPESSVRTRVPGRRPTLEEDPFNVFTTRCDVRGSDSGPLAGKTVGIKDNIDIGGVPTTNASATTTYVPTTDAVVVERILQAGGRIIGKLNMDDYASGATGETSAFGAPLNPLDPTRSAGGSSGGSGAALRCGAVDLALGGDQGGSARIPASYCGVVALKATHGLIPSHGMTHLGHTIDFVCPMARTVGDAAILLEVLAGDDWRDPQWVRGAIAPSGYTATVKAAELTDIRVGVIRESIREELCEPAVISNLERTAEVLHAHGAIVDTISVPLWANAAKITQTLICHLASSLIRSEGEGRDHLGFIDVDRLASFAVKRRTQGRLFPPYIKTWLIADSYLSRHHLGIPYGTLHNHRLQVRRSIDELLTDHDLLLTPTTPTTAPPLLLGDDTEAIVKRVLGAAPYNTAALNLSGHPALAVPNGSDTSNMPTSAQVIGRRFDEVRVLQVGRIIESTVGDTTGG
jgi:amidase